MSVIILLILSVFTLGLIALTVPVSITLSFAYSDRLSTQVSLSWWLNWIKFDSGAASSGPKRDWVKWIRGIPDKRALSIRFLRLLRSVLRCGRLSRLDLRARIGLDNPADTGRFYGAYCALTNSCQLPEKISLRVMPDFERTILEGTASAVIRITPLRVLIVLFLFCVSRPALRTVWALVRTKELKA